MSLGALLLDLDDTLVPEWEPIEAAWAAVAARVWGEEAGADAGRRDELWQAARAVWRAGVDAGYRRRMDFSLGEALFGEFHDSSADGDALRTFVPVLHATAFDAVLPTAWAGRSPELVDLFNATRLASLTLYDEVAEVLDAWSGRVPLVLVTNGASALQHAKLRAVELEPDGPFAAVIVGEDVGAGKPSPAPYRAAVRAAGVAPSEAVMVGNSLERDVAGARDAGLRAIHVRRDVAAGLLGADEVSDLRQLDRALAG